MGMVPKKRKHGDLAPTGGHTGHEQIALVRVQVLHGDPHHTKGVVAVTVKRRRLLVLAQPPKHIVHEELPSKVLLPLLTMGADRDLAVAAAVAHAPPRFLLRLPLRLPLLLPRARATRARAATRKDLDGREQLRGPLEERPRVLQQPLEEPAVRCLERRADGHEVNRLRFGVRDRLEAAAAEREELKVLVERLALLERVREPVRVALAVREGLEQRRARVKDRVAIVRVVVVVLAEGGGARVGEQRVGEGAERGDLVGRVAPPEAVDEGDRRGGGGAGALALAWRHCWR